MEHFGWPPGLRQLSSSDYGEWTAERFLSTAKEVAELTAEARQSTEDLIGFFKQLAIPVEVSKSWLDAIELLLVVMETAPSELLHLRGPGLQRSDFIDTAIRAEEALKNVVRWESKAAAAFYLDALPERDGLKRHIQTLRRGDGLFNFLSSDWRQAKAAFKRASKRKGKTSAEMMSEHFSSALSWKDTQEEFCANEDFSKVLGPLFNGLETDFAKVKKLHEWIRTGTAGLLPTELGQFVSMTSIPAQQVSLIAGTAVKVRSWISKIQQVSKVAQTLPGLDPALTRVRKLEELFEPLGQHGNRLRECATLLKEVARPTCSARRAHALVTIKRRISQHSILLRSLIESPAVLAEAGAALGMSSSPLSYQHLKESVSSIDAKARLAVELVELIHLAVGTNETGHASLQILRNLADLNKVAGELFVPVEMPVDSALRTLLDIRKRQRTAALKLVEFLKANAKTDSSVEEALASVEAEIEASGLRDALKADESFNNLFGDYFRAAATDEHQLNGCLMWGQVVSAASYQLPRGCANRLLKADAKDVVLTSLPALSSALASIRVYRDTLSSISKWGELDWGTWDAGSSDGDFVAKLEKALAGRDSLVPWSKYLAASQEAEKLGVAELVNLVATGSIKAGSLVRAFEYVFFRSLSRAALSEHRELARFSGAGHERLRHEYATLDKELIALNGSMYAYKVSGNRRMVPGVSSGRVGDLTEMALLHKETKKQKRHIPIRQLLLRAGRTLQELKPCFMMGPLSVAQYLQQGHLEFDLVVMDEASQLRPEDALGALARGKQLVVVGDPKQLPPTNFFGRLMEDETEDPDSEPAVIDGVESILGICEHLYRPVRTLRWHYRSQHESLIAFSNSQFYDGRLVVFPSPYKRNRRLGVNYHYVREGIYQDRRNHPEAQRVADAVLAHILSSPEESLGVVTLNQTQRELIEDLLDKKLRGIPQVAEYLDRHEKAGWGFFVKNLENVQGDERDVIFISTTFGRPPDSSAIRQNFGPINRPDGWRRLNVLFTRARRRIDLFSSLRPTDVVVDEKVSLGRKALRQYLEFAQTGLIPAARGTLSEREADSDFEIAVSDALRNLGYKTEKQVGVAGYFIDLGVKHPERPGEFLIGVECDGVTYHSSLSARDRDRIRQEVLESLGWRGRIVRVWSTDWFADPVGQTARLVRFLEQRLEEDSGQPAPFCDHDLQDYLSEDEVEDTPILGGTGQSATDASPQTSSGPGDLFVEVGDSVTYEELSDRPESRTVQIVEGDSNVQQGLLNAEAPLAQALLGLCSGDEATLRVGQLAPRVLRILDIAKQPAATRA